jgi:hypothetical protein
MSTKTWVGSDSYKWCGGMSLDTAFQTMGSALCFSLIGRTPSYDCLDHVHMEILEGGDINRWRVEKCY